MLCNDCHQPLFYCDVEGWYFHIDPEAPACFLSDSSHPWNPNSKTVKQDEYLRRADGSIYGTRPIQ